MKMKPKGGKEKTTKTKTRDKPSTPTKNDLSREIEPATFLNLIMNFSPTEKQVPDRKDIPEIQYILDNTNQGRPKGWLKW